MSKASAPGGDFRWLAGLLVLAIVVTILGLKAAQARNDPMNALQEAQGTQRLEVPQPLMGGASASASHQGDDPFPSRPQEQLDWAMRNKKPAMVLFHSLTCIPCKAMEKLVNEVRGDYEETIVFVDVITDDRANLELIRQAGIRTIPTSFFVRPTGQASGIIGTMTRENLMKELDRLVAGE